MTTWLSYWARRIANWPMPVNQPVTGHVEPILVHPSIDAEGWLVPNVGSRIVGYQGVLKVERVPSVRHSALTMSRGPMAIVWHYTATDHGTARSLARRIRTYRRGVDRAASWHVIIGHDGVIWQSVPFLRGAWHCAKGYIAGHRVNGCSVGIELEGHGDAFPEDQVWAAELLIRALAETYQIEPVHADHGHSDFDPARRSDPGPVWRVELKKLIPRVYNK